MLGEKELKKQKQAVGAHANDVNKLIDWLIFFGNCDWTRAWQAVMSNELSLLLALLFYVLPTELFENYSKKRF